MGEIRVVIYKCRVCGYVRKDWKSMKLHLILYHPSIFNRYREYIIRYMISTEEFLYRRNRYFLLKQNNIKPNQALRLTV